MGPYLRRPLLLALWLAGSLVGAVALAAAGVRGWLPLAGGAAGIGAAVVVLLVTAWARSSRGAPRDDGPERRDPVH